MYFKNSGNHIVYVDLYDMKGQGEILTYTFNIGTQSPFGYIFFIAIHYWGLDVCNSSWIHLHSKKNIKIQALVLIGGLSILNANRVVKSTIANNNIPIPR